MLRNEFIEIIKTIPKDKIVFIDEFGIEDNAYLNCGSSSIGRMCAMAKKAYQHTRMVGIVSGISNGKVIAHFLFDGNCNKSIFESYVRAILIKELTHEQTVILDNISFHKTVMIKSLIESVEVYIIISSNLFSRFESN
ncbi:transposase [Orientia tsutsugamushi]|uniref:transposase n=1 Tax=Orientia tsutsugamushi TaxID=784 RepID=UPI00315DA660